MLHDLQSYAAHSSTSTGLDSCRMVCQIRCVMGFYLPLYSTIIAGPAALEKATDTKGQHSPGSRNSDTSE